MRNLDFRILSTKGLIAFGATLLLSAGIALAADPDKSIADWLGKEITIDYSTFNDHIPLGGKLTLVYDADDDVVRVCTRQVASQKGAWKMDMTPGCNVALTFTAGERYCTMEDVKAGNAEVLSACHRLRSHDVAMHPAAVKGAVELHDMIVFLMRDANGKKAVAILVDSPARVTDGGLAGGHIP
jgi:hypothetical protein